MSNRYNLRSRKSGPEEESRPCIVTVEDAKKVSSRLAFKKPKDEKLCKYLEEELRTAKCLGGWKIHKLLGIGTIGTVLGVCKKGSACAAVKISAVRSEKDRKDVQREVRLQQKAAPYAPTIYEFCFFKTANGKEWAAIVMELISGEVDAWLVQKRTDAEILNMCKQVRGAVQGMCNKGMTHGDLVWFNIAYKKTGSGRMKFLLIDFDRSTDYFCDLRVEISRLVLEMWPTVAAPNQKKINADNARRVRQYFIEWGEMVELPNWQKMKKPGTAEGYWLHAYEAYCKRAKVKCLE